MSNVSLSGITLLYSLHISYVDICLEFIPHELKS